MVQIAALAIAAGVTAAVIGLAMAVAQAKVKMLMELTGKAMAQKIIDHRDLKAAATVDALASRVADDMDGDLARQSFVDSARDAGMTPEEAQAHWWETENERSFNIDRSTAASVRTDWTAYYVAAALEDAEHLTYEQAIVKVDRDEERIATAMAYLEMGHPVWMAIDMANADDMSDPFDHVDHGFTASDFHELTDDDLFLAGMGADDREDPFDRQERLDREMMRELESRKAAA